MTRDHQHNPDPNVNAARIVAESIAKQEKLAGGDLEVCWASWWYWFTLNRSGTAVRGRIRA
jgi:hypothetical protein